MLLSGARRLFKCTLWGGGAVPLVYYYPNTLIRMAQHLDGHRKVTSARVVRHLKRLGDLILEMKTVSLPQVYRKLL